MNKPTIRKWIAALMLINLNKTMETIINHPFLTSIAVIYLIGAIWIAIEIRNAPELPDE